MPLEFTKRTTVGDFRRIEADLKTIANVSLTRYKAMTPRQLDTVIEGLLENEKTSIKESSYGSWLSSDEFAKSKLLTEALSLLREYKEDKQSGEVLVSGFTYYRGVKQFGDNLEGKRCHFTESELPAWVDWKSNTACAKAVEVLRHGSEGDFKKIYVEMADGRVDALNKVSVEHITESSTESLKAIEEYCDGRWEGPWPWDLPSPYTLRNVIEDTQEMKNAMIAEMQGRFNSLVQQLNEAEMDQYEVVLAAQEMVKKVQGMIEDLGKISGEGLFALKDNARSAFGDQAVASLDQGVSDQINAAAESLSQLRATMEEAVSSLESSTGGAVGGAPAPGGDLGGGLGGDLGAAGGDLGSPADAMGAPPAPDGGDLGGVAEPDALADVNLDGEDGERPKKEI